MNGSEYIGEFVEISSDILPIGTVINVWLDVSVWYSDKTFNHSYSVIKSNKPSPTLNINGISSFDNLHHESDLIFLSVDVAFEFECDNTSDSNSNNSNPFGYEMTWVVYKNGIMLSEIEAENVYSFDLSDLAMTINKEALSVGFDYDFEVNMNCNNFNEYSCNISATHSLSYSHSDLVCQIASGNKYISNVTPDTVKSRSFTLDGDTFSYDPDNNNYEFEWKCTLLVYRTDNNSTQEDCSDSVFSELNRGVTDVSLTDEVFDSLDAVYIYYFEMAMYDSENTDTRDPCLTSSTLTIENLISSDVGDELTILDVSVVAASTKINRNEKLRLIANIAGEQYDAVTDYDVYSIEWSEVNGYLTMQDIEQYQTNANDKANYLVLERNVLMEGYTYEFEVIVLNEEYSEYGRASISIYVKQGPSIVDESFEILPIEISVCNGNTTYYSSTENVFTNFYDISVDANGDNMPLDYQFSLHFETGTWFWLDSTASENAFMDGMCYTCIYVLYMLDCLVLGFVSF